jgi:hypothetical protein
MARAISAMELSHSRAVCVAHRGVSCGRRVFGSDFPQLKLLARMGLSVRGCGFGTERPHHCNISFCAALVGRKAGIDGLGCGARRFVVCCFAAWKNMLIDGGGAFGGFPGREEHNGIDPGEEAVSPYLWSRGFQKLDVVALTHAHQDRIGGLIAILTNFRVGTLWIEREVESAALANLEKLAHERKIPIVHKIRGSAFLWDGVEATLMACDLPRGSWARAEEQRLAGVTAQLRRAQHDAARRRRETG